MEFTIPDSTYVRREEYGLLIIKLFTSWELLVPFKSYGRLNVALMAYVWRRKYKTMAGKHGTNMEIIGIVGTTSLTSWEV